MFLGLFLTETDLFFNHLKNRGEIKLNIRKIIKGLTEIELNIVGENYHSIIYTWYIEDKTRGKTFLVETGPSSVVPELIKDLELLTSAKPDYLLYTHVHLDHSGGAGQFNREFPNSKIIAPLNGCSHLIDPAKLVNASRESLGELCDIYGMPLPVPEGAFADPDLKLDGLTIIDTPGHSPHHISYLYDLDGVRILFPGEAAGCCFELTDGSFFVRPATPHKFYYETAMTSLAKLIDLGKVNIICYPHSGTIQNADGLLDMAKNQMVLWKNVISSLPENATVHDATESILDCDPALRQITKLAKRERERELFSIRLSVDGFLKYVRRNAER